MLNICHSWTGGKALRELQEANISQQCFPILLECATKVFRILGVFINLLALDSYKFMLKCNIYFFKAIKAASDAESDVAHLSGMSVMTLEGTGSIYSCLCILSLSIGH